MALFGGVVLRKTSLVKFGLNEENDSMKKVIIALILILILAGIVICIIQKNKPFNIIESKMNITLPSDSKIINFYHESLNGYFMAKVQIDDKDVESLKIDLYEYFKQELKIENINNIPSFQKDATWWDMEKRNIEVGYFTFLSGEKHIFGSSPKSIEVWAFIVKQDDGKHYLYISY